MGPLDSSCLFFSKENTAHQVTRTVIGVMILKMKGFELSGRKLNLGIKYEKIRGEGGSHVGAGVSRQGLDKWKNIFLP